MSRSVSARRPGGDKLALAWSGTHPDKYPPHNIRRYDCLIRGGDGEVRRYMVGQNDDARRWPEWLVWWNDDGGEGSCESLVCRSRVIRCLTRAKAACQTHYNRRKMVAPSILEINARAVPCDDAGVLAVMVAEHNRRCSRGCDAPFCNWGRIFDAFSKPSVCPACKGAGKDIIRQQKEEE